MKKKVIIVGARKDGHAKVVLHILLQDETVDVIGFIDEDPSRKGELICEVPVLGNFADLTRLIPDLGIRGGMVAIGNNQQRRKLCHQLESLGLELINAIHPSVIMDNDVVVGRGNYIAQNVVLVTGTKIGNGVNIHPGVTIDHDNMISDGANLGPGVHTAGRVRIGQDSFLGTGAVVIPDIVIEEGVVVGAGSVVIRNVGPQKKVVGNPAKEI